MVIRRRVLSIIVGLMPCLALMPKEGGASPAYDRANPQEAGIAEMEQPDSAAPANIILAATSDLASLLGRNCRARRARFKMSQGELSLRTGISASRLSLIETGTPNPTLEIMDTISRTLQITIPDLFST